MTQPLMFTFADDGAILNAADPADRLLSRAERRLALAVYRPAAFHKVTALATP